MSMDGKNPEISQILGIDYGKSKIGLALADSETKMAFAYKTIENNDKLLNNLSEMIKNKNVSKVVIGIPSYVGKGEVEKEALNLGGLLKDKLGVEVFYQNEMFTTKMAQDNLIEKGIKGIGDFDDQESARIILEDWLDKKSQA
jgi:putative Holliday junction resolvase